MTRKRTIASTIAVAGFAAVAILAGVVVAWLRAPDATPSSAAAVESFYRQTLRDASGATQPMQAHRGRPTVVNFWATWCVPCVREIPSFSRANVAAGGRVDFVGLGIDSADNIAAFNARFRPSYPLLAAGAEGSALARAFGDEAGALPFTVVIDAHGSVVASHLGRVDDATLDKWLAPYLDSAGGRAASS